MKNSWICLFLIFCSSCVDNYTPKPKAFIKLELPDKIYKEIDIDCPFTFELPTYTVLVPTIHKCLFDIDFPSQNARIHITYLPLKDNLYNHTEQSRNLAYKHNIVADAITEQLYLNDSLNVYGILYDYSGQTATATQFFLTDSLNHFFRGSLYFDTEVTDSILPLNNFLKEDVRHLIESFQWDNK